MQYRCFMDNLVIVNHSREEIEEWTKYENASPICKYILFILQFCTGRGGKIQWTLALSPRVNCGEKGKVHSRFLFLMACPNEHPPLSLDFAELGGWMGNRDYLTILLVRVFLSKIAKGTREVTQTIQLILDGLTHIISKGSSNNS